MNIPGREEIIVLNRGQGIFGSNRGGIMYYNYNHQLVSLTNCTFNIPISQPQGGDPLGIALGSPNEFLYQFAEDLFGKFILVTSSSGNLYSVGLNPDGSLNPSDTGQWNASPSLGESYAIDSFYF